MCVLESFGSHSLFCSSDPNRRSGSPRPIDWCAESSVASAECHVLASASARVLGTWGGPRGRAVVVDRRETEAAVLLGHLHAERAEVLEALDHVLRQLGLALDLERVHVLDEEGPQVLEEALALLGLRGVDAWLRMDQIEAEVAEEQLLAEARQGPLGLARRLGDFSRIALGDIARHSGAPWGLNGGGSCTQQNARVSRLLHPI